MDLSAFTKAGLKQKEIGTIVGVSHTTAGQWMRGKRQPHFLLAAKIEPILTAVADAVEAGELPLSSTVPRAKRMSKIVAIVQQYR